METLQDRPDIVTFVKEVALEQGIESCSITHAEMNEKGEGFLSQIYLITVEDSRNGKKLDIVIKVPIKGVDDGKYDLMLKCFRNENYFYSQVYPTFKRFEQSKGIEENIEFIPKYYSPSGKENIDKVCLENLKVQNFEVIPKKAALDDDHVSFIFKIYGRFHAYSYAFRDQKPEEFKELCKGVTNFYVDFVDHESMGMSTFFTEYSNLAYKYLIPGEDDLVMEKFKQYTNGGIVDRFRSIVTEEDDSFIILHGDCWSNNMMFKYQKTENGNKLSDLRLIDLQLTKIGSPVCDLSYCLYSAGCSKDILDNLEKYLKIYYESFSSFLESLGSDPEKLFPYKLLQDHWKRYSKFGMFMAVMMIRMKLVEKEDIKDWSDGLDKEELMEASVNSKFDEEVYRKRIRELLRHMMEIEAL